MADTISDRLSEVSVALYMLCIGLVFMAATGVLECSVPGGKTAQEFVLLGVVPLLAALYCMIGKGENWARIIFSTYCIVTSITAVADLWSDPPASEWFRMSHLSLGLAEMSVDLAALVLLFHPVSSAWFRAMSGLWANSLKSIFSALRDTEQPMLSYVWRAWLIAYFPSAVTLMTVTVAFKTEGMIAPTTDSPVWFFLKYGLLGPWGETVVMWPVLWVLKCAARTHETIWIALASAAIWAIAHVPVSPPWELNVFWGFFIFSLSFLEWEKKSTRIAIVVTALIHGCFNVGDNIIGLLLSSLLSCLEYLVGFLPGL